jgi:glycosyltransferase involved in cell wall biosynthesis
MTILPDNRPQDLISIVIPCYNHGKYLPDAIDSVLSQNHKNVEIVVVDDGSTDCTKEVVYDRYAGVEPVKYIYQCNQGLSAARNTGIDNSNGKYFVFLDADDWLVDDALTTNISFLRANNLAAFVSGGHIIFNEREHYREERSEKVDGNHYNEMLRRNYIGMHAAVMYQKWVFDEFRFDTKLKASEDYDLYLHVAQKYPVCHHTHPIAVYRFHDSNMSGDIYKMFKYTLLVLQRQKSLLKTNTEKKSFALGNNNWRNFYSMKMLDTLPHKPTWPMTKRMIIEHTIAFRYHPLPYIKYLKSKTIMLLQKSKRRLKKLFFKTTGDHTLQPGKINLGDLNRVTPFSIDFGYDRGGPVDRYYIENFLAASSGRVKGRVLEIGDNEYTRRFGGSRITVSDILYIDDTNPTATFVGDLSNAPHLPADTFDCIILTQTLHLIYDYKGALETCYRILKPGGALLLTVPGISHIHHGEWGKYWMWSFTATSIRRMLSEVFAPARTTVQSFGNVLAATAFLYAMGLPELHRKQVDYNDPQYQLIITATAIK